MTPIRTLASLDAAIEQHFWVLVVRGVAAIVFGLCALVWPGMSLFSLVLLYSAYCFADGVAAFAGGYKGLLWQSIATGAVSLLAGFVALLYPGATILVVVYLIALWSIARGLMEIAASIQFRKVIQGEWKLALAGVVSIAFGLMIALNPGAGAVSVMWLIGLYAIVFGGLCLAVALRIRQIVHVHGPQRVPQH